MAVLIFGLISGLHVDPVVFSGKERAFWPVAIATIVCPMTLGCLAGYWILSSYPGELLPGGSPVVFMTAVGICVSMIALPVLAAILEEMGLFGSRISHLALGVAGSMTLHYSHCLEFSSRSPRLGVGDMATACSRFGF